MTVRGKLIFLLALTLAFCGCRRLDPAAWGLTEETAELCIRVKIPQYDLTKGEAVTALTQETAIKNLYIWVYLSETISSSYPAGYCLGYISPNQTQHGQTAYEDRYFLRVPKTVALAENFKVDVYVLANRNAVGVNWGANVSRQTLDNYLISGNKFGIGDNAQPSTGFSSISNTGVPFSAVGKNITVEGSYPSLTIPTVTLKRAVSKIHFAVSQLVDAVGPVLTFSLDSIYLNSMMIAKEEYLFNDSNESFRFSSYLDSKVLFPAPAYEDIAHNTSPQDYAFSSGMSGQDYEDLILSGIDEGVLTGIGPYYLRETDKALSGRIVYTLGGEQKRSTFEMNAPLGFTRNHSWIIYIYFLRDQMKFTVSWTDWSQGLDFNLAE